MPAVLCDPPIPIQHIHTDDSSVLNLIEYMIENQIFNTYLVSQDEESEFSIILKNSNSKISNLLRHLGCYQKIKNMDPLIVNKESCNICFSDYQSGEYKRILNKCQHTFHKKCIDKWLKKNSDNMTCPICRTNYNRKIVI